MRIKYPNIENTDRERNLDFIREIVPPTEQWEVTEKTRAILPLSLQPIFETLCQYITENRFNNIESHEGKTFEFKDFKEIKTLFTADLMTDFLVDIPEAFDLLNEEEKKLINQFLSKEINNNLRVWLKR